MDKKYKILKALSKVIYPEMGFNTVDLGLVYDIDENEGNINVKMTLSSPSCSLSGTILS